MDLMESADRFKTAIGYCDDVVAVHRSAGGAGRGRRIKETTLNRAVVVMAMAAWQVVVENLTLTALDGAASHAAIQPGVNIASYVGTVRGQVKKFSTANSQQSRNLLMSVGYDPEPAWNSYAVPGRPAEGSLQEQLDKWMRVRHAIAHADPKLPAETVLKHVRAEREKQLRAGTAIQHIILPADPALRLCDAESCVKFVRRIAKVTGDGFASHVGCASVSWS